MPHGPRGQQEDEAGDEEGVEDSSGRTGTRAKLAATQIETRARPNALKTRRAPCIASDALKTYQPRAAMADDASAAPAQPLTAGTVCLMRRNRTPAATSTSAVTSSADAARRIGHSTPSAGSCVSASGLVKAPGSMSVTGPSSTASPAAPIP